MFSLLTARPRVVSSGVNSAVQAAQKETIPSPRSLDPTIDQALEALYLKALAKRTEDRYPTAQVLAEDVEQWLAGEPVSVRRETHQ